MEYVAHELGVPVVRLPALQRELSISRCLGRFASSAASSSGGAPTSSTPTRPRRARPGASPRASPAARDRRRRCTRSTGTSSRGTSAPARERAFIRVERLLARTTGALVAVSDEVRDDLVALGVAPRDEDRRDPVRVRPLRARAVPDDEERARRRAELEDRVRRVRRRLGRSPDARSSARTTSSARWHSSVASGIDGVLVVVGDGPERASVEALASRARRRRAAAAFSATAATWPAGTGLRRVPAHLRERGNPGRRDRGARERLPRRRHERRGHGNRRARTASPATSTPVGDTTALAARLHDSHATPSSRDSLGQAGRHSTSGVRFAIADAWPTRSTPLSAGSSPRHEGPAPPQDHRDQRLGAPSL